MRKRGIVGDMASMDQWFVKAGCIRHGSNRVPALAIGLSIVAACGPKVDVPADSDESSEESSRSDEDETSNSSSASDEDTNGGEESNSNDSDAADSSGEEDETESSQEDESNEVSDEESSEDEEEVDCEDQSFSVPFQWSDESDIDLPARGDAMTSNGDQTWICGPSFIAMLDGGNALALTSLDSTSAKGGCNALGADESGRVWVLWSDATLEVLQGDGRVYGTSLGTLQFPEGSTANAITLSQEGAWVAAGRGGLLFATLKEGVPTWQNDRSVTTDDARDVLVRDDGLLVADGQFGVHWVVDGKIEATMPSRGFSSRVLAGPDDEYFVLAGGFGVTRISFVDGEFSTLGTSVPDGSTRRGFVHDGVLWASNGMEILRMSGVERGFIEGSGAISRRDLGKIDGEWLSDLAWHAGNPLVIDGKRLRRIQVNQSIDERAPSLSPRMPILLAWDTPGDTVSTRMLIYFDNLGNETTRVRAVSADPGFTLAMKPGSTQMQCGEDVAYVKPGRSARLDVHFTAENEEPTEGVVEVHSDDPALPSLRVKILANPAYLKAEGQAPDFALLDREGHYFRLSEHRGKAVFLKFFVRSCVGCAGDITELQEQILPSLNDPSIEAFVISTEQSGLNADELSVQGDLKLPVLYDMELNVIQTYRQPGPIYPLQAVIDRDGNFAYLGGDFAKSIEVLKALQNDGSHEGISRERD